MQNGFCAEPLAEVELLKVGCRLVSSALRKLILNAEKFVRSTFGDRRSGFVERAMPPEVALAVEGMAISLL